MNDKKVVVDGLLANYRTYGKQGDVIVMLHGWGDSLNTFDGLSRELSKTNFVVCLDLPGFGQSDSPKNTWGLSEYASFVSEFCKKINLNVDYLVGHSNGGAISIKLVAQKLFKPKKLILLASSGVRSDYNGRNKALRIVTKTGKIITTPLPKSIKSKIRKKVYDTVGSDMLVAEHLQETFKKTVAEDITELSAKITIPTLLIYGSEDKATPVEYGEIFSKKIQNSKLVEINGAGHFIHHDKENEVTGLIKEYIK